MEGHGAVGHTYGPVTLRDTRAHLGDYHAHGTINDYSKHTYIVCSASHYSSQLLGPHGHVIQHQVCESSSLKRKRCLDEKEKRPSLHEEPSLEKALWKLAKFSKNIQDHLIGMDAKKVTQRIAGIIQAVQQQSHPHNDLEPRNHDLDDFENIDDCLSVARRVDINKGFQRSDHSKRVRTARRRNTATFGPWEIFLTTTTVKSRDENGDDVIKSLYSLCLEPQSPAAGQPVQAYFGVIEHLGRTFLPPVVFAYRIIPNDSKVFEIIKQDDLESLRELIKNGTATSRDCDEENRSLLHYACHYSSFQCCEYLIQKGADVERLAPVLDENVQLIRTPLLECFLDYYQDPHSIICSKLLLRAGADPTLRAHYVSPLLYALSKNTTSYLDLLCAEGGEFFDLATYREEETSESPWLRASTFRNLPILQALVSVGCNVAETDKRGRNCLHYFFAGVSMRSGPSRSKDLEGLLFLLSVFKHIIARDKDGRTVFDHVHCTTHTRGSYSRDLWYCALDRAGLDVSQHLAHHPRKPAYTVYYTPEHYHALKHLECWNRVNFRLKMDRLLEQIPLSHEESLVMKGIQEERMLPQSDWRSSVWEIINLGGQQIVRKKERKRGSGK